MLLRVPQSRRDLCLRAGEFSAPERGTFDPGAHLTFGDVVVDSFHDPRKVRVRIKASKTDPFREGMDVYFGQTGLPLCPVSAVLDYMVRRKEGPGPLFRFEDRCPLTRPAFIKQVKRWRSNAFQGYI